MSRSFLLSVAVLTWCCALCAGTEDWPMWRHDAGRTAATSLELPAALHLQWKRDLPKPAPTFPGDFRLCFDRSYEPVVAGKRLFLPSMVTDSVTALDSDSGKVLWRFFADGPVRFAPVAWQDKVYFVSDDGFLYCVAADNGRLLWKFSPMEPERQHYKLLGDERLISRWPARGGPVFADGTIYFAAGIWPFEGVAVCAVDAQTGAARWINRECAFVKDGLLDHASRFDHGVSPQGYLAVLGKKLIVPCGRALTAFFDRATGQLEPYTSGWGGRIALAKGSWYACGVGDYLFQSGDLYRIRFETDLSESAPKPAEYVRVEDFARQMNIPISTVDSWIRQFKLETVERDGERWLRLRNEDEITYLTWHTWSKTQPARPGEQHALQSRLRLEIDPTNAKELGVFREPVLTPEAFYYSVPAENSIRFVSDESDYRTQPKVASYTEIVACDFASGTNWQTTVLGGWGGPKRLAGWSTVRFQRLWSLPSPLKVHIKAGHRLYVGGSNTVAALEIPPPGGQPRISWQTTIAGTPHRMLAADDKLFVVTEEGTLYCFAGKKISPRTWADRSARRTGARDVWTERAAEILRLSGVRDGYAVALGIGSGRLVEELVRQSALRMIVLEPEAAAVEQARRKFFEMGWYGTRVHIVHGEPATLRLAPYLASLVVSESAVRDDQLAERIVSVLRPYGGTACLPLGSEEHQQLTRCVATPSLDGAEICRRGGWTMLVRRGGLPDAADWPHASGEAANTFASGDRRITGPLGVLWFGGGLDRVVPWVEGAPPRLPNEAEPSAYDGGIPAPRVAGGRMVVQIGDELYASDIYTGRHLWTKTVPALADFVVTDESVYAISGKQCLRLSAADGKPLAAFPSPVESDWRELRVHGDALVGTSGRWLVCLDRHSGALRWKQAARRDEFSFAVAKERVFCVDYWRAPSRRADDPESRLAEIMALRLSDGALGWRTVASVPVLPPGLFSRSAPPLDPQLSYSEPADVLLFSRNEATVAGYRGATGALLWAKEWLCKERGGYTKFHLPIVLADRFITHPGFVVDLQTGEQLGERLWKSRRGCPRALACPYMVLVRDGFVTYFDLSSRTHTYLRGIRSGCTASHIPAGGVVSAPHYMRHCNCNYPLSFSAAFVPMPEVASWDLACPSETR